MFEVAFEYRNAAAHEGDLLQRARVDFAHHEEEDIVDADEAVRVALLLKHGGYAELLLVQHASLKDGWWVLRNIAAVRAADDRGALAIENVKHRRHFAM
ncbi:hypothetical protein DQ04_00451050 [Trypanosoma grayi]|uniref:hypothetical protein n=1 Tax=Trypanosoma grayi TaxID=71804 RepID=UPI0004F4123B|nr:hypothetical protein DQ04_00451050 [Trypanosoma grayi]KEG14466.1 hypothetical protein DQ04_00451050 [Trypanosoma grayi]